MYACMYEWMYVCMYECVDCASQWRQNKLSSIWGQNSPWFEPSFPVSLSDWNTQTDNRTSHCTVSTLFDYCSLPCLLNLTFLFPPLPSPGLALPNAHKNLFIVPCHPLHSSLIHPSITFMHSCIYVVLLSANSLRNSLHSSSQSNVPATQTPLKTQERREDRVVGKQHTHTYTPMPPLFLFYCVFSFRLKVSFPTRQIRSCLTLWLRTFHSILMQFFLTLRFPSFSSFLFSSLIFYLYLTFEILMLCTISASSSQHPLLYSI